MAKQIATSQETQMVAQGGGGGWQGDANDGKDVKRVKARTSKAENRAESTRPSERASDRSIKRYSDTCKRHNERDQHAGALNLLKAEPREYQAARGEASAPNQTKEKRSEPSREQ